MSAPRLWRACALCGIVAIAVIAQQGPYQPYQEKLMDGVVDWDAGWIRADAAVPLRADEPQAQARVEAQRVALIKAQASALRIAMRLPVDSERRLESFEALRIRVKGIVAGGRVVSEGLQGKEYRLSLQVPVNGVTGIASEVSKVTLPPPPPPPAEPMAAAPPRPKPPTVAPSQAPPAEASSAFTPIVVDGTEAGVKPAMQTRILDPQGREVYSVKTVKPLVAKERMLARFVSPASGTGANPSAWTEPTSLSAFPLALVSPPWNLFAQRAPSQRPRGEQGLQVKAQSASGPLKADIVVTEETAKKLREADAATGVLSDGKVVVVVRADVGGVEGRYRRLPPDGTPELARR